MVTFSPAKPATKRKGADGDQSPTPDVDKSRKPEGRKKKKSKRENGSGKVDEEEIELEGLKRHKMAGFAQFAIKCKGFVFEGAVMISCFVNGRKYHHVLFDMVTQGLIRQNLQDGDKEAIMYTSIGNDPWFRWLFCTFVSPCH